MTMPTIGEIIRTQRKRAGLTLRDVAEATGRDFTYLSKIENGWNHPGRELLDKLAVVFGVPAAKLWKASGRCPRCHGTGWIAQKGDSGRA